MTKVGILTFHRCINYGSYWQARCLVEGLRAAGHDAVLLDHDDAGVRRAEWRCAFQPQLPARSRVADMPHYRTKARRILAAVDRLPLSPRFPLDRPAAGYDAIVVGSDEVWNFRHPWYGSRATFFGEGWGAARRISYAASFGNHDAATGIDPRWGAMLARFDHLSVRDDNARALVRQGTGREPAMVLDPCLQFPPPRPSGPHGHVALYGHGFPDWFAAGVRAAAKGRPIVSIGYRNEWADEQRLDAGPEEFAALMAGADAVATSFFHGCVFALLHGRPFVTAPSPYRFNKVRDLTRLLGAQRHVVTPQTPARDYAALLGGGIDPAVTARIHALRAQSAAFLDHALA